MSIYELSQGFLGIVGPTESVPLMSFLDRGFHVMQCRTGNVSRSFDYVRSWSGKEYWDFGLYGAASEDCAELVKLKAICEAAERYSSSVLLPQEYIVATANELGDKAFNWQGLPCLSDDEKALPAQLLHDFDPDEPIRWIEAVDMHDQRTVMLPVVMTHLYPRAWSTERFWNPISTGLAAHSDPFKAMCGAILEVIERDALALNWLLQRPLKRLRIAPENCLRFAAVTAQMLAAPDVLLYEATTDLGLPIIYARRYRPGHEKVTNVVACACDFSVENAVRKAISELVMISNALEVTEHQPPDDKIHCESLLDGATFMMRPANNDAFAFLGEAGEISLDALIANEPPVHSLYPEQRLYWLANRLQMCGKSLYLAELTCDELADVGLRSFRAVLPELMPMSFLQRSRFLGSQRLREFQRWLGREDDVAAWINPLPQPFA